MENRAPFNFTVVEVKSLEELKFSRDENIKVTVVDSRNGCLMESLK